MLTKYKERETTDLFLYTEKLELSRSFDTYSIIWSTQIAKQDK